MKEQDFQNILQKIDKVEQTINNLMRERDFWKEQYQRASESCDEAISIAIELSEFARNE